MDKPRLSANELAEKLAQSKKIMKKVDTGDYERGNTNENVIKASPEELVEQISKNGVPPHRPIGAADLQKINQSKLPDAIKRAMIENPIPEISLNDGLDIDVAKRARMLMEQDGTLPPSKGVSTSGSTNRSSGKSSIVHSQGDLETLIENIIRKVLDEKLNQLLTAQQLTSINESLVLKVGDSVFRGKITSVKKAK